MKEGSKPEYPKKSPGDELQKKDTQLHALRASVHNYLARFHVITFPDCLTIMTSVSRTRGPGFKSWQSYYLLKVWQSSGCSTDARRCGFSARTGGPCVSSRYTAIE